VGTHGEGQVRIWEGIWVVESATGRERFEMAVWRRRRWENVQTDI